MPATACSARAAEGGQCRHAVRLSRVTDATCLDFVDDSGTRRPAGARGSRSRIRGGFRGSPAYAKWSGLLHGFYDPFPRVTYFSARGRTEVRDGPRPETATDRPHRQLSQQSTPALWGRLVARTFGLPLVVEGHSSVSPASSRAVLFAAGLELLVPETSLAPRGNPVEPVHLHGVDDTSIHLCLPPDRAALSSSREWGEPHQYADFGTEIMVYGPRDEPELEFVVGLIAESVQWAHESKVENIRR